ncbi:MAG: 2OG-Fe(II) oxygenase [Acinetobacter sp.]
MIGHQNGITSKQTLLLQQEKRHTHQHSPLIFTVDEVFSHAECLSFIELSHQYDYETADIFVNSTRQIRSNVRNNKRVIYDDLQLAETLFSKLKYVLPEQLNGWKLSGLNERFRFYRYENGETFKPHWDGIYEVNDWHSSQLTLLIYLSEDFTGGETIFYRDSGMLKPCKETQIANIKPKLGQILVFEHQQLHEGAPVLSGQKYVLRTDVMYKHPMILESKDC